MPVAKADAQVEMVEDVQQEFEPVEFWNPVYPNERLVLHTQGMDPASAPVIGFVAGYFRATTPWQVSAIESNLEGRAFRGDAKTEMTCRKCGWITRSSEAFNYHMDQHS